MGAEHDLFESRAARRCAAKSRCTTSWWVVHFGMPTSRQRHQITETPAVAHALGIAARRWPRESRSRLLLRLVDAGAAALERGQNEALRTQQAAIEAVSGKYPDAFGRDYLVELRQEWPH